MPGLHHLTYIHLCYRAVSFSQRFIITIIIIAFFFLDTLIQIGFDLPIHVHFNISHHTLEEKESSVSRPLPSLSALPLLSPCSNSWMGFLLYMSYWRSSSSRLPPTSVSLIVIFLLSLSPTASVYLPGRPYHSPVTVIMSPTVSHCGLGSNECVRACVWMMGNVVAFTLVSICHIFMGECICVYEPCATSARRFFTHDYAAQTRKTFRQLCSLSPCANLSA